ncbi:FAD-dependent oxidoreductase [Methanopyrus sp.]
MRVVVVGGGAAGVVAARTAREHGADVVLISADEHIAYSPCAIPFVISGEIERAEDILMRDPSHYERLGIDVRLNVRVEEVDPEGKVVTTENGDTIEYDSLVLATGGEPMIPPIEGSDLDGVLTVRRFSDIEPLLRAVQESERAVIVGAGPIGVEMAHALHKRGLEVTLVEMLDRVLPQFLDGNVAAIVQERMEKEGVRVLLGSPVEAIVGDDSVEAVVVNGEEIETDLVVMAAGVRPVTDLFEDLGASILPFGVEVDPALRVKRDDGGVFNDIYAAGDCVADWCPITGERVPSQLGTVAVRQGKIAGRNAAGGPKATWMGTLNTAVVYAFGLEAAGTGLTEARAEELGMEVVSATVETTTRARYYPGGEYIMVKLIADAETHRIVGVQSVGGERVRERVDAVALAIRLGAKVEDLLSWDYSYSPPIARVIEPVYEAAELLREELQS